MATGGQRLGFTPTIGLREGLKRLLDSHRSLGPDPAVLLAQESLRNWET